MEFHTELKNSTQDLLLGLVIMHTDHHIMWRTYRLQRSHGLVKVS